MNYGKRLMVVAALALTGAAAQAKDGVLMADMATLDKAYINPLFFTSNMNPAKAKTAMDAFVVAWQAFAAEYGDYRPSRVNWASHFDVVEQSIAAARPLIDGAFAAFKAGDGACALGACPVLVSAHDALEPVRYELRDLRIHNGFPKFITDELTAFHDPMEAIVLTFKGRALADISAEELAAVGGYFDEAIFLWSAVEATPIDAEAWGFGPAQVQAIADRIALESGTLQSLAALYDARAFGELGAKALSLKANFVPVYTSFAGDPLLNKLP